MVPHSRSPSSICGLLSLALAVCGTLSLQAQEVLLEWHPSKDALSNGKLGAKSGPAGSFARNPAFDAEGHLIFDGEQAVTFPDSEARKVPLQNFMVEARVRVDRAHPWGSIVAYSQDNGSHERGWILGYHGSQFHFKLSTGGALSGAVSSKSFKPGEWASLVGLYDGSMVKLYVNGRLAASSPLTGEVALPKSGTPFVMGAYKDDDEYFPTHSRIDYVRISKGVLSDAKLAALSKQSDDAALAVQPRVSFPDPESARISWQADPGESVLYYGSGKTLTEIVKCAAADGRFVVTLPKLSPSTPYRYRIASGAEKKRRFSAMFGFDTRFNLSPAPVKPLPGEQEVLTRCKELIALAPDQSGYALVLGLHDGSLAAALAAESRFHVIAADYDVAKVAEVRKVLYQAGLLGHRVSVLQLSDPERDQLPWTDSFADLIVSERNVPVATQEECLRLVRPNGGVIAIANQGREEWQKITKDWVTEGEMVYFRRGALAGATDWTHQYGTPGNASYTREDLGDTSATSGMGVQWIGRPGGDFGIDRQPRMPAPLAVKGRLYHQGMNRLVALNAFNGAVLWSYEIPGLRRLNVAHDCSNWSADENQLYVAVGNRLWIFDGRSGELNHALPLPKNERATHEWGYVANEGEIIVGSAVRADSTFQDYWGSGAWFDKVGHAGATAQICSDRLFGYSKSESTGLWAYQRGLVINSTLALHEGRLYFLENRNLKLPEGATGRVSDRNLWLGITAVCLDARTGKIVWEKPGPQLEFLTPKIGFVQAGYGISMDKGYLAVLSEGTIDASGAYLKKGKFRCTLYGPGGDELWQTESPWLEDHHGNHITHPAVTEDRLYLAPEIHDLATGKPLGKKYGPRRGCSTIVATKQSLIFRILGEGNSPLGFWNKDTESVSRFPSLRPSCWLNTLPTQGMLLVPEGGAGCSCGGWIETSIGFLPRSNTTSTYR